MRKAVIPAVYINKARVTVHASLFPENNTWYTDLPNPRQEADAPVYR